MREFIGCDAHKKYSVFVTINEAGQFGPAVRVEHDRERYRAFLRDLACGAEIALETVGNWYWMVEEMEQAGHRPHLAHAAQAKKQMGGNKTDRLDARGLARLLRNGTLPEVWIPPAELRDQRELVRMRMHLVRIRTGLKNRIQAILASYAITLEEVSDPFGVRGRHCLAQRIGELPPETRQSVEQQLQVLERLQGPIQAAEQRIKATVEQTPESRLLDTEPGIGPILSLVIVLHTGDIHRFPSAGHYLSYCGLVPRVRSSGGRTWLGRTRPDVNRYLKWAFLEAANAVVVHQRAWAHRHVVWLYRRIRNRSGHGVAATAVARHLAEAAYWMLKKGEPYREPKPKLVSSTPRSSATQC